MTAPSNQRFRFGLRTLLILFSVVCAVLGFGLYPAQRYQRQKQRAEAMIVSLGGKIETAGWGDAPSPGANWFSMLCGYGENRETRWKASLAGTPITPEQVKELGKCGWIRVLDFSHTCVGDDQLDDIVRIGKLRELRLAADQVTDAGVAKLKRLDHLYVLDVFGTAVTFDGLADLEKSFAGSNFCEQLAIARLGNNSKYLFAFPKAVANSSEADVFPPPSPLQVTEIHLDTGGSARVSDEDVACLRWLDSAKVFRVQGRSFQKGGLAFLANLKNLESVALYDTKVVTVHDDDLITVASLPKLKHLELYGNEMTNDGIRHLSTAHQIESLSVHGFQLTPQLLVHLRDLQGLKQLDLIMDNHRAHNEYIEDPTPEELAVAREGMKNLAAIPSLETLNVMGNLMTDDVVAGFAELKQLKSLRLDGRSCSQETADLIQRALPNCKIERPVYK